MCWIIISCCQSSISAFSHLSSYPVLMYNQTNKGNTLGLTKYLLFDKQNHLCSQRFNLLIALIFGRWKGRWLYSCRIICLLSVRYLKSGRHVFDGVRGRFALYPSTPFSSRSLFYFSSRKSVEDWEVCWIEKSGWIEKIINKGKNTMKDIPVLYERKEDCCGCTACYAICPKGAITMKEDEEGFEYPQIDEKICVRCGMCLKVCPIKEAKKS